MSLFIVQLAKMTLVVLGIFFTPVITRKFVSQIQLAVAQDMMKYGGMMWAAASGGAVLAATRGRAVSSFAQKVWKDEAPSLSFKGSRWLAPKLESLGSSNDKNLFRKMAGIVRSADDRIQSSHLKDQAKKQGLHIPSKKDIQAGRHDPLAKQKLEKDQAALNRFMEQRRPMKDPISSQRRDVYIPPPGNVMKSIQAFGQITSKVGTPLASTVQKTIEGMRPRADQNSQTVQNTKSEQPNVRASSSLKRESFTSPSHGSVSNPPVTVRDNFILRVDGVKARTFRSIKDILDQYKDKK